MGAAPLSWLAKIGGDTLKTKAKLLSSAINELYDNGFKKKNIVGLDYIKAATAADLKNKVPEANAVKELNSNSNNYYHKNIQIVTPVELAQTPSSQAYSLAPICINADGSSNKRAGIGFHNQGTMGAFLYLENDARLHLILSNGTDYPISYKHELDELNSNLSNINVWKLDSTVKTHVPCSAGYGAFLVLGYMTNIGAVSFTLTIQGGNVSATNLNGIAEALNFLIFEHNAANGVLYMSPSDNVHSYRFTVIGYAA